MKEELKEPAVAIAMAASVNAGLSRLVGGGRTRKKTARKSEKCEKWIFGIFPLEPIDW